MKERPQSANKENVRKPRQERAQSQPVVKAIKNVPPIESMNCSFCIHSKSKIQIIDIDSLKLSTDQFNEIIDCKNYNEQLSLKMPDANAKLYVCNNTLFQNTTTNAHIVIKEMEKCKLQIGQLSECRIDIKVHTHLQHEDLSVIKLLGWFEDDERFCTLYEYAKNGDLLEELNTLSNPFHPKWFKKARYELLNIAQTLAYMHREGWSHKDLTLENILVDENGNFYLHDFALVEEFNDDASIDENLITKQNQNQNGSRIVRHSSIWSGKVEHMSPENYDAFIGNNNELFDAFSNDIWGLGVIIMCCFSTQSFLWDAPDTKINSYMKTIQNISSKLNTVFKIDQQKNKIIKNNLLLLIDLLKLIFVTEDKRIDIAQVLTHPFFANVDPVAINIDNRKPCCDNCIIL